MTGKYCETYKKSTARRIVRTLYETAETEMVKRITTWAWWDKIEEDINTMNIIN